MSDDWAYAPIDPADRALARPQRPEPEEHPARGAQPRPARSTRPPRRLRADAGARSWALLIDAVLFGVVAFVIIFLAFIASTPFWDVADSSDGTRARTQANGAASASVYALNETVPTWVSWVILVLLAGVALGLSGALGKPGRKRSLGMVIAEVRVVRWPMATTDPHELPPDWGPATVEPVWGRVAARWLLPLAVFAALSQVVGGLGAALVALAGWAPSLLGARRSLYDWVAGVAVVDAVRLAALGTDARALDPRSPDTL